MNNSKLCYINYLPIWNFIIFIFLPPKTILGPITGGSLYLRRPIINYFIRKYVLNIFGSISRFVLNIRHKKLLFSTNLLEKKIINKENCYFNYVLKDIKLKKTKKIKKIDLLLYLRSHSNKNSNLLEKVAIQLSTKFKVATVGERIKSKLIKNYGYIPRQKLEKKLKITKFSLISSENFYSFFAIDCIINGVILLHNKLNHSNNHKIFSRRSIALDYNNPNKIITKIENLIINYKKKNNKIFFKNNFKSYFLN